LTIWKGQYYDQLLGRFDDALKEKPPHLAKKKVLFHQANASTHQSLVAAAKLVELGCKLLPHPPYSPDLATYDFFLFPNMKKWLGVKRFASNEEVITETETYLAEFN
jgi:histone-lysine N-methyltransferase SETMAR